MSGEPKTLTPQAMTLEEFLAELGNERNASLARYKYPDGTEQWAAMSSWGDPLEWAHTWPELATKVRGVPVVARYEAAEAKPIGWDDVADEDVMAALVKAQTEANVLKRAVREWVAADAAYSEWMVLPVREDWTSGEAKARKERLEVAEAELRRLAGGESQR